MPEAHTALQSDSSVDVRIGRWLIFSPADSNTSTALIIYPGGRVDPRSYAPAAHTIAARGYLTIIVPMPLNLAVLGVNSAANVIESYPEIQNWAIGGHSLGGTMAAQFAHKNASEIKGLVFWAAYPASGNDLSKLNIAAVTIHGSNDGLVSQSQIDDSLGLLPVDTVSVEIEGGNHAQFGWYGGQPGDNEATISRELQQDQIVTATAMLLEKLGSEEGFPGDLQANGRF
jgi:pimeloyl-ACP methyl ester carboxylesterase